MPLSRQRIPPPARGRLIRGQAGHSVCHGASPNHTRLTRPIWHFIVMPTDVLRAIGGNLKAIIGLAQVQMPTFQKPVGKLQQLLVDHPPIVTSDEQIDDILELMNATHNQIDIIESLAGSHCARGSSWWCRVRLTTSKPASNLSKVYWHCCRPRHVLVSPSPPIRSKTPKSTPRLRFFGGEKLSRQTLIYGWQKGKLGGNRVYDDYSHFVASQLRLDAELVSQQTRGLDGGRGMAHQTRRRLGGCTWAMPPTAMTLG